MANKPSRYKEMERYMTYALCADAGIFLLYLICAVSGIVWLKVILTLVCLVLSSGILWLLYTTKELYRQRSLWITTGALAIIVCLIFSLILKFPSPNKYKSTEKEAAFAITQQL